MEINDTARRLHAKGLPCTLDAVACALCTVAIETYLSSDLQMIDYYYENQPLRFCVVLEGESVLRNDAICNTDSIRFEQEKCTVLKMELLSCMTPEVKHKIIAHGFTPDGIATAFILKKLGSKATMDYSFSDCATALGTLSQRLPAYNKFILSTDRSKIIDIEF